jgi:hypothetical protein
MSQYLTVANRAALNQERQNALIEARTASIENSTNKLNDLNQEGHGRISSQLQLLLELLRQFRSDKVDSEQFFFSMSDSVLKLTKSLDTLKSRPTKSVNLVENMDYIERVIKKVSSNHLMSGSPSTVDSVLPLLTNIIIEMQLALDIAKRDYSELFATTAKFRTQMAAASTTPGNVASTIYRNRAGLPNNSGARIYVDNFLVVLSRILKDMSVAKSNTGLHLAWMKYPPALVHLVTTEASPEMIEYLVDTTTNSLRKEVAEPTPEMYAKLMDFTTASTFKSSVEKLLDEFLRLAPRQNTGALKELVWPQFQTVTIAPKGITRTDKFSTLINQNYGSTRSLLLGSGSRKRSRCSSTADSAAAPAKKIRASSPLSLGTGGTFMPLGAGGDSFLSFDPTSFTLALGGRAASTKQLEYFRSRNNTGATSNDTAVYRTLPDILNRLQTLLRDYQNFTQQINETISSTQNTPENGVSTMLLLLSVVSNFETGLDLDSETPVIFKPPEIKRLIGRLQGLENISKMSVVKSLARLLRTSVSSFLTQLEEKQAQVLRDLKTANPNIEDKILLEFIDARINSDELGSLHATTRKMISHYVANSSESRLNVAFINDHEEGITSSFEPDNYCLKMKLADTAANVFYQNFLEGAFASEVAFENNANKKKIELEATLKRFRDDRAIPTALKKWLVKGLAKFKVDYADMKARGSRAVEYMFKNGVKIPGEQNDTIELEANLPPANSLTRDVYEEIVKQKRIDSANNSFEKFTLLFSIVKPKYSLDWDKILAKPDGLENEFLIGMALKSDLALKTFPFMRFSAYRLDEWDVDASGVIELDLNLNFKLEPGDYKRNALKRLVELKYWLATNESKFSLAPDDDTDIVKFVSPENPFEIVSTKKVELDKKKQAKEILLPCDTPVAPNKQDPLEFFRSNLLDVKLGAPESSLLATVVGPSGSGKSVLLYGLSKPGQPTRPGFIELVSDNTLTINFFDVSYCGCLLTQESFDNTYNHPKIAKIRLGNTVSHDTIEKFNLDRLENTVTVENFFKNPSSNKEKTDLYRQNQLKTIAQRDSNTESSRSFFVTLLSKQGARDKTILDSPGFEKIAPDYLMAVRNPLLYFYSRKVRSKEYTFNEDFNSLMCASVLAVLPAYSANRDKLIAAVSKKPSPDTERLYIGDGFYLDKLEKNKYDTTLKTSSAPTIRTLFENSTTYEADSGLEKNLSRIGPRLCEAYKTVHLPASFVRAAEEIMAISGVKPILDKFASPSSEFGKEKINDSVTVETFFRLDLARAIHAKNTKNTGSLDFACLVYNPLIGNYAAENIVRAKEQANLKILFAITYSDEFGAPKWLIPSRAKDTIDLACEEGSTMHLAHTKSMTLFLYGALKAVEELKKAGNCEKAKEVLDKIGSRLLGITSPDSFSDLLTSNFFNMFNKELVRMSLVGKTQAAVGRAASAISAAAAPGATLAPDSLAKLVGECAKHALEISDLNREFKAPGFPSGFVGMGFYGLQRPTLVTALERLDDARQMSENGGRKINYLEFVDSLLSISQISNVLPNSGVLLANTQTLAGQSKIIPAAAFTVNFTVANTKRLLLNQDSANIYFALFEQNANVGSCNPPV